jgi:hypothetical protein
MMGVNAILQGLSSLTGQQPQQQKPLFSAEGPDLYAQAYQHNAPFAKPGPYQTTLPPADEQQFRQWVSQNRVPFDPSTPTTDYDMRGYYQAMKAGKAEPWKGAGSHFPDTYKTPYDTTFSGESQYAQPNTPFVWRGNTLIDKRTGQIIFGNGQ